MDHGMSGHKSISMAVVIRLAFGEGPSLWSDVSLKRRIGVCDGIVGDEGKDKEFANANDA